MRVRSGERDGALGITLMAVLGFSLGLVGGTVLGGALGAVHRDRVRRALGRLRRGGAPPDPATLVRGVHEALRADEATRDLDLEVHAAADGLIELTGIVSDALVRRAAGDIARGVPGVDVVVNRILVQGSDLPPQPAAPASRRK